MMDKIEAAKKLLKDVRWSKTHTGVIPCPRDYGFYIQPYQRAIDQAIELLEPSESAVEDEDPKLAKTERGFSRLDFTDRYGVKCSLQKSSLATEDCIWLGCNDANLRVIVPGKGWTPMPMPDGYIADTRMHLTQEQVRTLLPYLIAFANTGEVNSIEPAVAPSDIPRFAIEFHRGVYFSTPELGTCDVIKASDYDADLDAQSSRDRDIWEMIDKTQSCTSGKSNADCLEWIKEKLDRK